MKKNIGMINSKFRLMFAHSGSGLGKGQESQKDTKGFPDADLTLFLELRNGYVGISLLFFYLKCAYILFIAYCLHSLKYFVRVKKQIHKKKNTWNKIKIKQDVA